MPELDEQAVACAHMTELQRIACDALQAAVRLCNAAGVALVPGPTTVRIWVQQRGRPSRWSSGDVIDLPQIMTEPRGRAASRTSA